MGGTRREKGVLKLVHPGRHVEIHKEPIIAAEIMRKNPRHCITRPDVFEDPRVVVKPEAILHPGKVFFIVPNHKIYSLLKARGYCSQPSPQESQSPNDHVHQLKQTSTLKSYAGMTPKHQNHDQSLAKRFHTASRDGENHREHNCVENLEKQSQLEPWPEVIAQCKNTYLDFDKLPVDGTKIGSSYNKECHFRNSNISAGLPKNEDVDVEFRCSKQVTQLKSSLRKEDSFRKSLGLRVTFVLPNKDDERQGRVGVSPTEFSGFLT